MILLDVNVLVYAHREDAPRHAEYRRWLETALAGPEPCGLSELVLSGCLRVLTHPRVFSPPTPLDVATRYVQRVRAAGNVHIVTPGARHWNIFLDLCRHVQARGNAIPDAYHAALAIESGCEWITADSGFGRFPGLRWRRPFL
jgi:uncharacterized protein